MPRAKRGFKRRRKHNKILQRAEGFVLGRKNKIRRAAEAVDRSFVYAYRDRRVKKRTFRQLWIARLSAAVQSCDISYNQFIFSLKNTGIGLNRKILSELAIHDPEAFHSVVSHATSSSLEQK